MNQGLDGQAQALPSVATLIGVSFRSTSAQAVVLDVKPERGLIRETRQSILMGRLLNELLPEPDAIGQLFVMSIHKPLVTQGHRQWTT